MMSLILLACLLFLMGALLWMVAQRKRRLSGMSVGRISYSDTSKWQRNKRPLYSSRYGLTGKPDYLVQQGRVWVPIEVKSTRLSGRAPYYAHVMQLAAYCLLVEDVFGVRPDHGILQYADATIRLDYTDALRRELLATLSAMRRAAQTGDASRHHEEPARCRHCGYRDVCSQALG